MLTTFTKLGTWVILNPHWFIHFLVFDIKVTTPAVTEWKARERLPESLNEHFSCFYSIFKLLNRIWVANAKKAKQEKSTADFFHDALETNGNFKAVDAIQIRKGQLSMNHHILFIDSEFHKWSLETFHQVRQFGVGYIPHVAQFCGWCLCWGTKSWPQPIPIP